MVMVNEMPPWLTTALTSGIAAVITFLLTRGLYRSTIKEKDAATAEKNANALSTMTEVAANLAKQVEAFTAEIPVWKQKIAVETERADKAERRNSNVETIFEQAKMIVEQLSHITYLKEPGEPESSVEKRFKAIKAAAKKIAACVE